MKFIYQNGSVANVEMCIRDRTGDLELLEKEAAYFKDKQIARGTRTDTLWDESYGCWQKMCIRDRSISAWNIWRKHVHSSNTIFR